jgi:hypothetical protein
MSWYAGSRRGLRYASARKVTDYGCFGFGIEDIGNAWVYILGGSYRLNERTDPMMLSGGGKRIESSRRTRENIGRSSHACCTQMLKALSFRAMFGCLEELRKRRNTRPENS